MKKFLSATVIALALGIFAPAVTSQAATTTDQTTQPDYITKIETQPVNQENYSTAFNTIDVKDTAVPVYELDNGAIKETAIKASPNSSWTSTTLVETKSGGLYYKVSDNGYISGDEEFVIVGVTLPLFFESQD